MRRHARDFMGTHKPLCMACRNALVVTYQGPRVPCCHDLGTSVCTEHRTAQQVPQERGELNRSSQGAHWQVVPSATSTADSAALFSAEYMNRWRCATTAAASSR